MSGPATQSSRARGYKVLIQRVGRPLVETARLIPLACQAWTAPKFGSATFEYFPADAADAMRWHRHFNVDDRIVIQSRSDDHVAFCGYLVEAATQWDAKAAHVIATANSAAWRLYRDVVVYGQYRRSLAQWEQPSKVTHYDGLPLVFNPDGVPNRAATNYWDVEAQVYVPVFTDPGSPGAQHWTWLEAFDYLQWHYNVGQTHIRNIRFTSEERVAERPMTLCEDLAGLRLWEAMELVVRVGNRDLWERPCLDALGNAIAEMRLSERGKGTRFVARLQAPGRNGTRPVVDPRKTNMFAGRVTVDAASCVACPIVAGGRTIYEVAVPLVPAWDAGQLDAEVTPPGVTVPVPEDCLAAEWAQRYVVGGAKFAEYGAVGRLWLANTDKQIAGQDACDLAELVGEPAGSWPVGLYPPLNLLDDHGTGTQRRPYVQISFDGGGAWQRLGACEVLADRLGCYIMADDLRTVRLQPTVETPYPDVSQKNLWYLLWKDSSQVQLRLVCCVAGPRRALAAPARRGGAGTRFDHTAWFDRGAAYQVRRRASSSPLYGTLAEDESDGRTTDGRDVGYEAQRLQDLAESRLAHANLCLPWIDPAVELCMVVEKIEGVEIPLGTNAGPARVFPRIVGIRTSFQQYAQDLTMDTDREAPMR